MLDQLNIHVGNDVCALITQNTHANKSIMGVLTETNKIIKLLKERRDYLPHLGKGRDFLKKMSEALTIKLWTDKTDLKLRISTHEKAPFRKWKGRYEREKTVGIFINDQYPEYIKNQLVNKSTTNQQQQGENSIGKNGQKTWRDTKLSQIMRRCLTLLVITEMKIKTTVQQH